MKKTKWLVHGAIIAALYVVLTEISSIFGLSSGVIQVRFSEALNVLACYTTAAIPGLYIGCIIANLLTGAVIWDVLFGGLATLIGVLGTYFLRKHRIAALMCPVVSNALIIPCVLKYAYGMQGDVWYFTVTVAAGEIISCVMLGCFLGVFLEKYKRIIFK